MLVETYLAEFVERDLAIEVGIGLNDGPVNELLELHVVQVAANHHLQDGEQLSIGNESVVIDVVDLEGKAEFVLITSLR